MIKTLALATAFWLTLDVTSVASQSCSGKPNIKLPVVNPDPADRQAIMDVIHSYAWTLDDHDISGFRELFTEEATYEACSGGGKTLIFKTASRAELVQKISMQFSDLVNRPAQTRHLQSNTLLNRKDDRNVEEKTTLLVTIQRGDVDLPEIDYQAVHTGTLTKDGEVWRFQSLTLVTDQPTIQDKAR